MISGDFSRVRLFHAKPWFVILPQAMQPCTKRTDGHKTRARHRRSMWIPCGGWIFDSNDWKKWYLNVFYSMRRCQDVSGLESLQATENSALMVCAEKRARRQLDGLMKNNEKQVFIGKVIRRDSR